MENDFLNLRCGWRVALLYGIMQICKFIAFFFFFFFVIQNRQTKHALKTSLKLSK